ncbi:oxygenase MpaB family protein [Sphingomonas sp. GCM10030256]|uniref:oxygenase MpaB family protein n=1 Tax=Sphingomonas sp. GCM10030256 TaxID=3273427 RepID=UPI0036152BCC
MATLAPPAELLRRQIVGGVRSFFNDQSKGERPVVPSDDALIPRGSVAWRVHGDVASMMVGGIAALLLQMLHPAALAGVWDHSDFRRNMHGRLRNTARFIAVTTFGEREAAEAAIARVRGIHDHVNGVLPDETPYDANDPMLLSWVHLAGGLMFLDSWIRFGEPEMSSVDRDAYWRDVAPAARMLGAEPVPVTAADAAALLGQFPSQLRGDERTRTVRNVILRQPPPTLAVLPVQTLLMRSAVDLLPSWARRMHGLRSSGVGAQAVGAATTGLARTIRWAFRS